MLEMFKSGPSGSRSRVVPLPCYEHYFCGVVSRVHESVYLVKKRRAFFLLTVTSKISSGKTLFFVEERLSDRAQANAASISNQLSGLLFLP